MPRTRPGGARRRRRGRLRGGGRGGHEFPTRRIRTRHRWRGTLGRAGVRPLRGLRTGGRLGLVVLGRTESGERHAGQHQARDQQHDPGVHPQPVAETHRRGNLRPLLWSGVVTFRLRTRLLTMPTCHGTGAYREAGGDGSTAPKSPVSTTVHTRPATRLRADAEALRGRTQGRIRHGRDQARRSRRQVRTVASRP